MIENIFRKYKIKGASDIINVDDLYKTFNTCEAVSGFKIFNFHRKTPDGPIEIRRNCKAVFLACLICITLLMYFIVQSAINNYYKGNIKEVQDAFVGVSGLMAIVKLFCIVLYLDDHLKVIKELDALFPRTLKQQQRMNIKAEFDAFMRRYHIKMNLCSIGAIIFYTMPIVMFSLDSDRLHLKFDHFVVASYLPYGLKEDIRFYPVVYILEVHGVSVGIYGFLAWDHCYQIQWHLIIMHFRYINQEIERLCVENTNSGDKANKVHREISAILHHHRLIKRIAKKCNDAHKLNYLLSDTLMSATICTFAYMVSVTSEFVRLMRYISVGGAIVMLLYDFMAVGEQCRQVTSDMRNCFFNLNWPDSSHHLGKDMVKLIQYSEKPFELNCYGFYTIDMAHFQVSMTLSYKMFTFLKSAF